MSNGLNADGRLEVFARGNDHRIYHNWQKAPGAGPWNGFTALGDPPLDVFASGPSVHDVGDRHLHVFVRGLQNDLWHIFQKQLNGTWSGWESFGRPLGGAPLAGTPVPATREDMRMIVFSTDTKGEVQRLEQQTLLSDDFQWADSLGGDGEVVGSPAACSNGDGRLVVFAVFNDGVLRFNAQTQANFSLWAGWQPVTGPATGTPAAILNQDLRIQIILPSAGGQLVGIEQITAGDVSSSASWGAPMPLNGIAVGVPAISRNSDGRLEAFHTGLTNALYHMWQATPDGKWSPWNGAKLQNLKPGCCAGRNNDQRLEVFAIDDVGNVEHTWQKIPSTDPWEYESLGGASPGDLKLEELGFRGAWWFRE